MRDWRGRKRAMWTRRVSGDGVVWEPRWRQPQIRREPTQPYLDSHFRNATLHYPFFSLSFLSSLQALPCRLPQHRTLTSLRRYAEHEQSFSTYNCCFPSLKPHQCIITVFSGVSVQNYLYHLHHHNVLRVACHLVYKTIIYS